MLLQKKEILTAPLGCLLVLVAAKIAHQVHLGADKTAQIIETSKSQVLNISSDPELPVEIDQNMPLLKQYKAKNMLKMREGQLAQLKPNFNGDVTFVFAGQCASCSLKSLTPFQMATRLKGSHLLVLVYVGATKSIEDQFRSYPLAENTLIIADSDGRMTSAFNAGSFYRHALGTAARGKIEITKLQKPDQPDLEFYK